MAGQGQRVRGRRGWAWLTGERCRSRYGWYSEVLKAGRHAAPTWPRPDGVAARPGLTRMAAAARSGLKSRQEVSTIASRRLAGSLRRATVTARPPGRGA